MKAIQPIAIINPSDPQKIRKFRDKDVTQICDSQSGASPRRSWPTTGKAQTRRFQLAFVAEAKKAAGWACDKLAKKSLVRAASRSLRGRARGGPSRLGVIVTTPCFSCCEPTFLAATLLAATLRVKKSLPDRGGCSMINNLPKLMGESAARGRFQDEILSCFR
jgi:hypothetical protein